MTLCPLFEKAGQQGPDVDATHPERFYFVEGLEAANAALPQDDIKNAIVAIDALIWTKEVWIKQADPLLAAVVDVEKHNIERLHFSKSQLRALLTEVKP